MKYLQVTIYSILFIFLFQSKSFAVCPPFCDSAAVFGMVKLFTAKVTKTVLAGDKTIVKSLTKLDIDILASAKSINSVANINTATIIKAIQSLQESNALQIKTAAIAKEATKTHDTFASPAALPKSICGGTNLGAGVQIASQVTKKLTEDMRKKQFDYSNTHQKPIKYQQRIVSDEHPKTEEMFKSLMPTNMTLTQKELADAQETIKSISNPAPAPMITEEIEKESAAYTAARKIHETRLSIAQAALTEHVAYHAPTLPTEVTAWASEQWKATGSSGPVPGVVDGKMSQAALFNLLSQMRIGNANYSSQLASLNETGLMRELVQMQSAKLELIRKNNELLDRLRILAALDYLTKMDGSTSEKLNELYARTIGAQQ